MLRPYARINYSDNHPPARFILPAQSGPQELVHAEEGGRARVGQGADVAVSFDVEHQGVGLEGADLGNGEASSKRAEHILVAATRKREGQGGEDKGRRNRVTTVWSSHERYRNIVRNPHRG